MNSDPSYDSRPRIPLRLIIALLFAAGAIWTYFSNTDFNQITNQKQHVAISPQQEIVLGLQSAPSMVQQYGGDASDSRGQSVVTSIGNNLIQKTDAGKAPYRYQFHLLADPQTINAFALPGGQIFITEGLLKRLSTPGEIADVLAHEVGHVVARHSAQHLAKQELTNGLTGAAVIATYDPNDPSSRNSAAMAALIGEVINLKFSRNDELEADKLGVRFASDAGYDPRSMISVMKLLDKVSHTRTPEFFSTHPNPGNRIQRIQDAIAEKYPNGVPDGLIK